MSTSFKHLKFFTLNIFIPEIMFHKILMWFWMSKCWVKLLLVNIVTLLSICLFFSYSGYLYIGKPNFLHFLSINFCSQFLRLNNAFPSIWKGREVDKWGPAITLPLAVVIFARNTSASILNKNSDKELYCLPFLGLHSAIN